jgi:hypothetical protein
VYNFGETTAYASLSTPSLPFAGGYSDNLVDINDDGTIIIYHGLYIARVFQKTNGNWQQLGSDIELGEITYTGSINLSSDGLTFYVTFGNDIDGDGNTNENGDKAAKVFNYENGSWVQKGQLIEYEFYDSGLYSDMDSSGQMFVIGDRDNINSNNSNNVRVYKFINNIWTNILVFHNENLGLHNNSAYERLHFKNGNSNVLTFFQEIE